MTPFIAIACIIVGTICLLIGVFAAYTRRFGAQLVKDAPTNADPISVLIPAHNEEHCIAACVGAVLNQRGVNLKEVIVILDRCTDGTAAALVPLQADPRLRVMSLSACPSDWAGKVHALHYGSMQATGDWLVFIDCDVVVGPDLLRRARGSIGDNTLLSLIMDFRSSGIWDMLMIPLLGIAVNAHRPLRLVHDRRSKVAAASGQFMMFPTHRYRALGGHAAVRGELLEDLALAERVKHHGEGVMLAFTNGGAQVEMYSDWSSFHR
ncbi:MAG: glycosyltransferase family 2 protein, partial [Myxococcota bacterium]